MINWLQKVIYIYLIDIGNVKDDNNLHWNRIILMIEDDSILTIVSRELHQYNDNDVKLEGSIKFFKWWPLLK